MSWNWIAYRKNRELECRASEVLPVRPMGEILERFLMQLELFECHFLNPPQGNYL
jgi:hypothetical protein